MVVQEQVPDDAPRHSDNGVERVETKCTIDWAALSEGELLSMIDRLPVGIGVFDHEWRLRFTNRAWGDIVGTRSTLPDAGSWFDQVHPADRGRVSETMRDAVRTGRPWHLAAFRIFDQAGNTAWVSSNGSALPDRGSESTLGFISTIEDVSDHVAEQAHNRLLAAAVESTRELVGIMDDTGTVLYLNQAARDLFGLPDPVTATITFADAYPDEAIALYLEIVRPELLAGRTWSGTVPMIRHDGATIFVHQNVSGVMDANGELVAVSVGRDVTASRAAHIELTHQASRDSLTGLANRGRLLDVLDQALDPSSSTSGTVTVAVLFIDLDDFKSINDRHGHPCGDHVLRQVACTLEETAGPDATVARLGGDEFVVVLDTAAHDPEPTVVAERIEMTLASRSFEVDDTEVQVGASIGIGLGSAGEEAADVLRRADAAMYVRKALRGQVGPFVTV